MYQVCVDFNSVKHFFTRMLSASVDNEKKPLYEFNVLQKELEPNATRYGFPYCNPFPSFLVIYVELLGFL